jgi:FtsP/CotA-like multicopper oxidase with cupredoxin domain
MPVEPGADFLYEFTATNPGTRWYHSHVDGASQLELGLYGAMIVDPRDGEPVKYDREFTYVLDEKALDFTPEVAMGDAQLRYRDAGNGRGGLLQYDLFLMNGKAGDAIEPLHIAAGEKVRIRLVNAGSLPHAIHLHGMSFKVIASDGNRIPEAAQLIKDTVLIGPAERYDLEVDGTNPGIWMFHCHMPNHQDNGMMTAMVYDGFSLPDGGHSGH